MNELISIVVPVYNLESEITACVESICAQTYPNLEIILVDDGSSDNSWSVIQQLMLRDNRIVAIHQENQGVTSARLTGIARAVGDFIGFVDGDDYVEPQMYERLLHNALAYHADISHCGYQMVFPDGRIRYFHNSQIIMERDRENGLIDLLQSDLIEPGLCNKLFRQELFVGLAEDMDRSIKINEDLLMNFYLFKGADKSVFEDVCPYHYLIRNASASRQRINRNKIFDPIKVKQRIVELSPPGVKEAANSALFSTCLDIYNSLTLTDRNVFLSEKEEVHRQVLLNWKSGKRLGMRRKVLAWLIRLLPGAYPYLYRLYAKYFQHSPYQ